MSSADRETGFTEQVGIVVREGHLGSVDETLSLCCEVGPDHFDQQDRGGLDLRGDPSEPVPQLFLEEIFEDAAHGEKWLIKR